MGEVSLRLVIRMDPAPSPVLHDLERRSFRDSTAHAKGQCKVLDPCADWNVFDKHTSQSLVQAASR
jgi:hypothetical protein